MARRHDNDADEKDEDSTGNGGTVKRRGFLTLAGAAVLGAGATSTMGTARAATVDLGAEGLSPGDDIAPYLNDHWRGGNEVHIPAGTYELSDPDVLGISTSSDAALIGDGEVVLDHGGSDVDFNVVSGGGHIRFQNLTLRGVISSGRIAPYATDDNGVIEFVNFNRPDGCHDGTDAGGFYVPGTHSGTNRFINCHIEAFSNNGIYASSPGKDGLGKTEVYGGLYKNNDVAGVRLGGPGDKAISVAIVNDEHGPGISGGNAQRGIRIREPGPVTIRDCDITQLDRSGVSGPIMVENHIFNSSRDGGLRVENTRIRNDIDLAAINHGDSGYESTGDGIHLTGSGNLGLDGGPYENVVEGNGADAPVTEKRIVDLDTLEPVDGGGSSGGSGGDGSDDISGSKVEVVAASGVSAFNYAFVATGAVAKVTDDGSMSAEGNDTTTENSDGTTEVTGRTGNGFGDAYQVEGDLVSFESDTTPDDYTLLVDGEEIDPSTLGDGEEEPDASQVAFQVVAAEGGPAFAYTFLVTGTVALVTDDGSMSAEASNDTVTENSDGTTEVTGRTGNGFGDTFAIDGSLDAFEADTDAANYTLLLDGEEIDPQSIGNSDEPSLPNRIVFDASDGREGAYAFQVTGEVMPDPDDPEVEEADVISGGTVEGELTGTVDAYLFSGDVTSLELIGAATVRIEDVE